MQEIEVRNMALSKFHITFIEFQKKFSETTQGLDNIKDLPRFIERSIPLMIHFQLCEGLRNTLDDVVPKRLSQFEKTKLKEL